MSLTRRSFTQRTISWFGVGGPDDFLRYSSVRAPDDFEQLVREIVAAKPEVVVTHEFATLGMPF